MRCLGITKSLERCKNECKKHHAFCRFHRWQWLTGIFSVLTVIGLLGGIYQDVLKPLKETSILNPNTTKDEILRIELSKNEREIDSMVKTVAAAKMISFTPFNELMDSYEKIHSVKKKEHIIDVHFKQRLIEPNIENRLELVDVFVFDDNNVDIKLRNIGDEVHYLKGVQFVFGPMFCGSTVCMYPSPIIKSYWYTLEIQIDSTVVIHRSNISEVAEIAKLDTLTRSERILINYVTRQNRERTSALIDSLQELEFMINERFGSLEKAFEFLNLNKEHPFEFDTDTAENILLDQVRLESNPHHFAEYILTKIHYSIKRSPYMNISRPVKPKEVDRFSITINLVKEMFMDLPEGCFNSCSLSGYIILYYNKSDYLISDEISLTYDEY